MLLALSCNENWQTHGHKALAAEETQSPRSLNFVLRRDTLHNTASEGHVERIRIEQHGFIVWFGGWLFTESAAIYRRLSTFPERGTGVEYE